MKETVKENVCSLLGSCRGFFFCGCKTLDVDINILKFADSCFTKNLSLGFCVKHLLLS